MICASTLTLRFVFSVFDVDYTHLILWLLAVSTYVFIAPTIFIYLRSTAAAAAFFHLRRKRYSNLDTFYVVCIVEQQ